MAGDHFQVAPTTPEACQETSARVAQNPSSTSGASRGRSFQGRCFKTFPPLRLALCGRRDEGEVTRGADRGRPLWPGGGVRSCSVPSARDLSTPEPLHL